MEKKLTDKAVSENGEALVVYEVSYLLLPSLALEQVAHEVVSIKEAITSWAGSVISDENPVMIDLAYPMTKVTGTTRTKVKSGYFGWVKFEVSKDDASKLTEGVKKLLDEDDSIVRYLLLKTVRENTLLHGKMKLSKEVSERTEDKKGEEVSVLVDEVPKESSVEEIDKSIDGLVIV